MKTELLELAKQMENPVNHDASWRRAWAKQLRALAARPCGEVTDAMVKAACHAFDHAGNKPTVGTFQDSMRAALEAALQSQPKEMP